MGTHYLSIVLGFCEKKRGKGNLTLFRPAAQREEKENLLSRACSSLFNGTLIIYDPDGSFGVTFFRKIIKRLSLGFTLFLVERTHHVSAVTQRLLPLNLP